MKFIKLDLLTLLISLFLFASCENSSTIGLEVDPSIAIQGALVDTITISSRTMQDDIESSNSLLRTPLGYLQDPIFGTTESSLSMVVNLPNEAYTFGTSPVLDSAVLVMNYGGEFYGDSTSNYAINVYQLRENLAKGTSFLSSKDWLYFNTVIGSKTGKLYPTTKYKVTDVVTGKADTMRTVTPQLRIALDKSYMQALINNLSTNDLRFYQNFTNYFNGLRVDINKANSSAPGGLAFFDFAGSNSRLEFYYKNTNSSNTKDTIQVGFPISTANNPVVASIKHNYTGTPIATQLANPTTQYPVTYLQPLAGLRNKISFPYLSKFISSVGKVAINKAELVIDLSTGTDAIPFNAAPRLALYRYDIAERRQNLPDNNPGSQNSAGDPRYPIDPLYSFGGYYNILTKQYIFNVSGYLQDLLDGKTKDYGTFLAVTPTTEFDVYPTLSTGARSVIGAFKKNPAAADKVMKLNIYYTKIN